MSKIESGKINLSLSTVNLPELVQSISDICRPLVTEKQQQFQVIIGHVRHENVIADGDRLQQILMNLLSNSIKYTPENGTITLKINEQYSSFSGKSQYEFICMDTGIGIPKDFIPYIFEPFTRAEDPRISKLQGTGLGMTITQNIIRLMNGTIHVDSTPGAGSAFTASIPLEFSPDQASVSRELIGRPVLIVHEDPAVCNNAALLLNELGMRGSAVFSLEEALRRMRKAHEEKDDFFAVIVDYMILQTDNGQAFRAMRGSLGKFMPILIIAAYDYSDIETAYTNAEADAFVVKPLFKSKMIQVLNLFTAAHSENEDTGNPKRPLDLTGKRVLLAEDNDINREIATELLQMQGIVVDAVENGLLAKEAFAAAAPGTYNAILLDIQMPVMDGYDAAKRIRALKRSDAPGHSHHRPDRQRIYGRCRQSPQRRYE